MHFGKLGLAIALTTTACATDAGPAKPGSTDTVTDTTTSEALVITNTEKGVSGTFADTTFTSEMTSTDALEITVHLNGMVITALVDYKSGLIETDGYTADTGANTQMTDEDRASLLSLEGAMAKLGDNDDLPFALAKFRGFIATWAEHPSTVDMQALTLTDENRSWTSLCYAKNTYYPASHDCNVGGFYTDATQLDGAYLSLDGDQGGPDGVAWYFPAGGSYQACSGSVSCSRYNVSVPGAGWYVGVEIDHDTRIEYAYGNCFGVCGAGCPGSSQFTVDCVNHDECVRNGHVAASAYCDDQFASASDDWASAPNCGG